LRLRAANVNPANPISSIAQVDTSGTTGAGFRSANVETRNDVRCSVTFPDQQHATLSLSLTSPIPKAPESIEASLDGKSLAEALDHIEALIPVVLFELLYPRK
jgi:hypothetical protein